MTEKGEEIKVTYVCCNNNMQLYNQMLAPSLQLLHQEYPNSVNWLVIDTIKKKYKGAAIAFNTELENNKELLGDILVFCHNDIRFDNSDLHDYIVKTLYNDRNQIIGVAGKDERNKVPSNLRYYENKQYITKTRIEHPARVCSVDECCFAMTKELYFKIKFDEKVCFNWHLYAADICYAASLFLNTKILVSNISIFHKMNGNAGLYTDSNFLRSMWLMVKKYHNKVNAIYTTAYLCSTNYLSALLQINRTAIKNIIKH